MAPQIDCVVNKYSGREIAQLFGPFGICAQTDDGKVFPTLADAIAYVRKVPEPEAEAEPEPEAEKPGEPVKES